MCVCCLGLGPKLAIRSSRIEPAGRIGFHVSLCIHIPRLFRERISSSFNETKELERELELELELETRTRTRTRVSQFEALTRAQ